MVTNTERGKLPTSDLLQQGIAALKAGRRAQARKLLAQVVQQDRNNELAWLWLSGAVDTNKERRICLERVLAINPSNDTARRGLESILAKEGLLLIETLSQATPEAESTETPQRHPQPPSKVDRPSVSQRISAPRPQKASKKRTGLIVGLVAGGIVAVVGISLVGIWWAISSGLLEVVAPSAPIPTATPVPTATPIPTWTPTPTPDARARVEEYLAEFCPLFEDKYAIMEDEQHFWDSFDGYRLVDDSSYRNQIVTQRESLMQRNQTCNDKLRSLSPPLELSEHHRLLVAALNHDDLAMKYLLESLRELDTILGEQSLEDEELDAWKDNLERSTEELNTYKDYLERSLNELDRVATELGFEHPCPSLPEEISVPAEPTVQATALIAPTSTPLILPTLTPIPQFVGTEAEFKAHLRSKYSSIAGNELQIEDILIIVEEDSTFSVRAVNIELTRDSALYVFSEQTEADALEYGTNLLHDTMAYFGGRDCSAFVSDSYYTHELEDYHFDEEWYYIGDYDLDDGWYISKDYVKAHFIGGVEEVEVWNWR